MITNKLENGDIVSRTYNGRITDKRIRYNYTSNKIELLDIDSNILYSNDLSEDEWNSNIRYCINSFDKLAYENL